VIPNAPTLLSSSSWPALADENKQARITGGPKRPDQKTMKTRKKRSHPSPGVGWKKIHPHGGYIVCQKGDETWFVQLWVRELLSQIGDEYHRPSQRVHASLILKESTLRKRSTWGTRPPPPPAVLTAVFWPLPELLCTSRTWMLIYSIYLFYKIPQCHLFIYLFSKIPPQYHFILFFH
jgi:hypothetical protein